MSASKRAENMKTDVPADFTRVFTSAQIEERTRELGREVGQWAAEALGRDGRDILAVPVLRGAIFFFADFVREVSASVEIAPIRAWGYDPARNEMLGTLEVNLEGVDPRNRSILLVDDICDSGRTLHALKEAFLAAGAADVRSVVLIRRLGIDSPHVPDWVGFPYPGDDWFVGYGMDDRERWRNLPDIYVIKPEKRGE